MLTVPRLSYSGSAPEIADADLVHAARDLLGLLEFEFFRLAWTVWHGSEANDRDLERGFMAFLFRQEAPGYVRHFARRVLEDEAQGCLDPVSLGVGETVKPASPLPDLRNEFTASCLAIALGVLLVIIF